MYCVVVTDDENKYFRTYAKNSMTIDGCICIQVDELPIENDFNKKKFYKLVEYVDTEQIKKYLTKEFQMVNDIGELSWEDDEHTIPIMITVADIDEETGEQKFELVNVEVQKQRWDFNKDAYDAWVEEQKNIEVEPTVEEKVDALQLENEMLNDTMDYLLTIVIPSMME